MVVVEVVVEGNESRLVTCPLVGAVVDVLGYRGYWSVDWFLL